MAPFDLWATLGPVGGFLAYLAIGFAFGFVLESAGFGDARKLAGQFYFRDLSVVRVMFTAILTAMCLLFATASMGWLDWQDVWVNPTYLVPGVVGGFVMGFGFIVGGYCPGTSLAAAGSGKVDGMMFVAGALGGMFAFGELADELAGFMQLTAWGRYTLPEAFGTSTGVAIVGCLGLGVVFFTVMNSLQRTVWMVDEPGTLALGDQRVHPAALLAVAAALLVPVFWFDLPDADRTYALRSEEYDERLASGAASIDPGELLSYVHENGVRLRIIDVRDETSWNLFHLTGAERVPADRLDAVWCQDAPANQLVVVVGAVGADAVPTWRRLTAMKVPNTYLLDGGLQRWLERYGAGTGDGPLPPDRCPPADLCWGFDAALGDRQPASRPSRHALARDAELHAWEKRVKLQTKARKGGGCG
jgi:rhodanese-related sulfurtransferase